MLRTIVALSSVFASPFNARAFLFLSNNELDALLWIFFGGILSKLRGELFLLFECMKNFDHTRLFLLRLRLSLGASNRLDVAANLNRIHGTHKCTNNS